VGQLVATFLFLHAFSCAVFPLDANISQEKFSSPLYLNGVLSSSQFWEGDSEIPNGALLGAGVGQTSLLQTPGQFSKISGKVTHLPDSSLSSN
jgi:hypothetical protein